MGHRCGEDWPEGEPVLQEDCQESPFLRQAQALRLEHLCLRGLLKPHLFPGEERFIAMPVAS